MDPREAFISVLQHVPELAPIFTIGMNKQGNVLRGDVVHCGTKSVPVLQKSLHDQLAFQFTASAVRRSSIHFIMNTTFNCLWTHTNSIKPSWSWRATPICKITPVVDVINRTRHAKMTTSWDIPISWWSTKPEQGSFKQHKSCKWTQ